MAFFEELGRKAKDVAAVAADKAKGYRESGDSAWRQIRAGTTWGAREVHGMRT